MGTKPELERLIAMLDATGVRPLIDDEYALEDARDAFARMVEGELFGKLVLTRG
jgi:NADPH:quinone reductase-like Zn-dependent oxidoreductase